MADALKYNNARGTEEKISKIEKIKKMFESYQESFKPVENSFVILDIVDEKVVKEVDVDENLFIKFT